MNTIHTTLARNGFARPATNRVVGGVCAGIARRYGLDPWAVRILLVVTLIAIPGSQILLYPIVWILMPADAFATRPAPYPYTGARHDGPDNGTHDRPQDVVA